MATPRFPSLTLVLAPALALAAPAGNTPPQQQIVPPPVTMPPAQVTPVTPAGQSPSPTYVQSPACEVAMADLSKAATDLPLAQAHLESARQERRVPGASPEADLRRAREELALAQTEQDKANNEMAAGHCR